MTWDRAVPPIAPLLVPIAFAFALYGQAYVAIAVLVVFVGMLVLVRQRRRRRRDDIDWHASTRAEDPRVRPARGSVAVALTRVEMRELLLSPWFAAGAGFCVLFGSIAITGFERSWWLSIGIMPMMVHPLCGMTIIATHRNLTRARRDGAEEMFTACPADTSQRTTAHLLTAAAPVAVGIAFVAGTMAGAAIALNHIYGPIDDRVVADALIAALLLPAGAVALGVLLGRRARLALAPFAALAVIALLNLEMWDRGLDGRGWLATAIPSIDVDFIYLEPPVVGRLLWFTGLGVIVSGLALTTGKRRPATTLTISIGAVVAIGGLVLTVRPLSEATVDRLTEYVLAPDKHETCARLTAGVEVCALNPYRDHGADLAENLQPVAEAIQPTLQTPITARLLVGTSIDQLPSQVQQRIVPTPVPLGMVEMPFGHKDGSFGAARFFLAAAAVGLPSSSEAPQNLLLDGQARGVVVLWFAMAGLSDVEALAMLEPDEYAEDSPSGEADIWPATCGADLQWAPQDIAAARSLVGIDRARVSNVISSDWSRWTSPETTTDDLLVALDLPRLGPADPIEPLGDGNC